MKFPVFDLHCDTALAMIGKGDRIEHTLRNNKLHIDLTRAAALDGYCQCFACFTTPEMQEWFGKKPVDIFEREMVMILSEVERNSDLISLAYSADDVRRNYAAGKMSAVLTIEGTAGIGHDPALLEDLYQIGFRVTTLGWNEKNILAGSNVTGGGLTDRGRAFVKEAQKQGFIVDVSHISDEAFWDIMDMTEAPIIASHSNSRAVCGHSRNLTDDMFREIVRTGGVAGFNHCVAFVSEENPDLDRACDHILHFMEMDPEGTHIALGGDLDGTEILTTGFEGIQDYPRMAARLLERGLDEKTVRNIFWNNALGVMDKCCI